MLLAQLIPPSPPPTVSTSLFSVSASPLLPCKQAHQYHPPRFHIYASMCEIVCPFLTYFTQHFHLLSILIKGRPQFWLSQAVVMPQLAQEHLVLSCAFPLSL